MDGAGGGSRRTGRCYEVDQCRTRTAKGHDGVKRCNVFKSSVCHSEHWGESVELLLSFRPCHAMKFSIIIPFLGAAAAAAADTTTAPGRSPDLNFTTAEAGNPLFDGWFADPEIRVYDGVFWIFATTSVAFKEQKHFNAWASIDLTRWCVHSFLSLIRIICAVLAAKGK